MEYRELKRLQEKAMDIYAQYHQVNFADAGEVLNFLWEIHPFAIDPNINLPKEHLMHLLERHGYGMHNAKDSTHRMIANLIQDIELEEFMFAVQVREIIYS